MPLWFFPVLLVVCAITSLVAALWLLIHLQDVARVFRNTGANELVPQPAAPRTASKRSIWLAILLFNAGWIACLAIWVLVISGDANAIVSSRP